MHKLIDSEPGYEWEVLFVDDGSRDGSVHLLETYHQADSRFCFVSLSRNFGKEAALLAGFDYARGDAVVIMDADLQHPPAFLPKMYNYVKDGDYDCATTRRVSREGESKVRSAFARLFYKIMNKISQTEIVDGAQDFRFMSRQMVDAILDMPEYNRFSKGIFSWVGFRTRYIEYENVERPAGTSSWSFWGLFKYSLEGIFAFSTAPLAIAAVLGAFICFIALILLIFFIIKACVVDDPDLRFLAAMCIMSLLAGLQLFSVGILGQYLSRTYLEVKHRPIYLMRENEELYREKCGEETA